MSKIPVAAAVRCHHLMGVVWGQGKPAIAEGLQMQANVNNYQIQ